MDGNVIDIEEQEMVEENTKLTDQVKKELFFCLYFL